MPEREQPSWWSYKILHESMGEIPIAVKRRAERTRPMETISRIRMAMRAGRRDGGALCAKTVSCCEGIFLLANQVDGGGPMATALLRRQGWEIADTRIFAHQIRFRSRSSRVGILY